MEPDIQQSDNSSGKPQMSSSTELHKNTPEQCSCLKGNMACLPSDDDGSLQENEPLEKQLARLKECALVYREDVTSLNKKITKLQKIIHMMIEIDKKAVVEGEKAPEIKSDIEKLQKFRALALDAEAVLKKNSNDGDKKAKNVKEDTEDDEEGTESSEEETESSEDEMGEGEMDEEEMREEEALQEALRRSLSEWIGSSSEIGSGSMEAGATTSSRQFYNSNDQQGSSLAGSSESGSSSCQTNLLSDSMKYKSTADAFEIMKNKNEAKLMQRKRKRDTKWGSEEDMLCALTEPEMLLEAVCALYRTERERRTCRIEVPYRHPTDKEFEKLTQTAIILMEGNMSGPNKKTAEGLEMYIRGGLDFCAQMIGTCSTQLFHIYSRGWDEYFC